MSQSNLTNTPTELRIGGETFLMSALTDRDMAELDEYVQAKMVSNARRALEVAGAVSDEQYNKLMALALKESLGLSWSRPPGSRVFTTEDGLARLAWQGIKRNQPHVTVDQIRAKLSDSRNVVEVHRQWKKVNTIPESVLKRQIEQLENVAKGNGEANAESFPESLNTAELSS